jgi:hypothetical protein
VVLELCEQIAQGALRRRRTVLRHVVLAPLQTVSSGHRLGCDFRYRSDDGVVVPRHEASAAGLSVFETAESIRKIRPVFEGSELAFRLWVLVPIIAYAWVQGVSETVEKNPLVHP